MDEILLELELLNQYDEAQEEAKPKQEEEEKPSVSPYQSAAQEGMGLLSNLFSELDMVLAAVFDEADEEMADESGTAQSEEGMKNA